MARVTAMNDKALTLQQIDQPLTVADMHHQVQLIQQILAAVMKPDTHYGVIPGTGDKPSLLKPGAEKIMATFRLSADPIVEDLGTDKFVRYRVTVRLTSPSGHFVGAGIGECSSQEEKYCWRKAVCEAEFDEAPLELRREKWKKFWDRGQPRIVKWQQIKTEPADLANTVLKMAKKRALVDAVLTATAASDIFTQDLEDLPPELHGQGAQAKAQATAAPAGVAAQQPAAGGDGAQLIQQLETIAHSGWSKLQEAWQGLSDVQRAAVGSAFGGIKAKAMAVGRK